ncbi:MAG TPA: hypothetical protein VGR90_11070 [Acidimicrobiales bacterium]|nr:hypothetical protein [Acidimicrobiales bacterium]
MSDYALKPPTDDEMAAILAAVEAVWPRPRPVSADPETPPTAWRFSGRWWARPLVARRDRPWRW